MSASKSLHMAAKTNFLRPSISQITPQSRVWNHEAIDIPDFDLNRDLRVLSSDAFAAPSCSSMFLGSVTASSLRVTHNIAQVAASIDA